MKEQDDLLTVDQFLTEAHRAGINLTRRGLQLYSSPRLRLIPTPIHRGGYISHMPRSAIERLKLIKALNTTYQFSLPKVRQALDMLAADVYPLILSGKIPPIVFETIFSKPFVDFTQEHYTGERITLAHVMRLLRKIISECEGMVPTKATEKALERAR